MASNILESIEILANASRNFAKRCVDGLEVDEERTASMIEKSMAMVTSLAPVIGYDKAAAIAKEAHVSGRTVREVALEQEVLSFLRQQLLLLLQLLLLRVTVMQRRLRRFTTSRRR